MTAPAAPLTPLQLAMMRARADIARGAVILYAQDQEDGHVHLDGTRLNHAALLSIDDVPILCAEVERLRRLLTGVDWTFVVGTATPDARVTVAEAFGPDDLVAVPDPADLPPDPTVLDFAKRAAAKKRKGDTADA